MTGEKIRLINCTLHQLDLDDSLKDRYEIIELPVEEKKKLIIATEKILKGEITMINEQHRILSEFKSIIPKGANLYIAGHPALILCFSIIAEIKGCKLFTGLIDINTKKIVRIEELLAYASQLNREFRFDIEHS